MSNERYVTCIRCAYAVPWIQHERMRFAMACPMCDTPDQFGPGVYVPDFAGYTSEEVMRQRRTKQQVMK